MQHISTWWKVQSSIAIPLLLEVFLKTRTWSGYEKMFTVFSQAYTCKQRISLGELNSKSVHNGNQRSRLCTGSSCFNFYSNVYSWLICKSYLIDSGNLSVCIANSNSAVDQSAHTLYCYFIINEKKGRKTLANKQIFMMHINCRNALFSIPTNHH